MGCRSGFSCSTKAAVLLDDFLRVEWHSRLSKRMAGYEAMEDDAG